MTNNSKEYLPGEAFLDVSEYDEGIQKIVPHYGLMLDIITGSIPESSKLILDLGSGTGGLGLKILDRLPDVELVAVDYSERMTGFMEEQVAKKGYLSRVSWIRSEFENLSQGNYPELNAGTFDAIVSSMAIHHLNDISKKKLFNQIYIWLKPGGHFWQADVVLPSHDCFTDIFLDARNKWLQQHNTSREKISERMVHDKLFKKPDNHNPGTLNSQLKMLEESGFNQSEVLWKYFGLAVFGGIK